MDSLKDIASATAKSAGFSLVLRLLVPFAFISLPGPNGKLTETIAFSTSHGVCRTCLGRIRTRRILGTTLEVVAKFLFLLGLIAVPFAALAYFWLASRSERGAVLPWLVLAVGMLVAGSLLNLPVRSLRIPRGLQNVAGSPFELTGLKRVD